MAKKSKLKNIGKRSASILLVLGLVMSMAGVGVLMKSVVTKISNMTAEAATEAYYIYFDNGLSGYDKVEYATSADNYTTYYTMYRLDSPEAQDKLPLDSSTNINKQYVYVTQNKIAAGTQIKFRGTASGRVYDTVSNYQTTSASREWGYDYVDFVWTTDPLTVGTELTSQKNCYYAPALAMQNKYMGQKSDGTTEQFIKPVGAATGSEEAANIFIDFFKVLDPDPISLTSNSVTSQIPISINNISTPTDANTAVSYASAAAAPIALVDLPLDGNTFTEDATITDDTGTQYVIPKGTQYNAGATPTLILNGSLQVTPVANARLIISGGADVSVKNSKGSVILFNSHIEENGAFPLVKDETYTITTSNTITELTIGYKGKDNRFDTFVVKYSDVFKSVSKDYGNSNYDETIAKVDNVIEYKAAILRNVTVNVSSNYINFGNSIGSLDNDQLVSIKIEPKVSGTLQVNAANNTSFTVGTVYPELLDKNYNTVTPSKTGTEAYQFDLVAGETYYLGRISGSRMYVTVDYSYNVERELENREPSIVTAKMTGLANGTSIDHDTSVVVNGVEFTVTGSSTKKITSITNGDTVNLGGAADDTGRAIKFKVTGAGSVTFSASISSSDSAPRENRKPTLYNGPVSLGNIVADATPTKQDDTYTLSFTEPGTYYLASANGGITISDLTLTYNDPGGREAPYTLQNISSPSIIYPEDGTNRTFIGYEYKMEGIQGSINDVNRIGEVSINPGEEGSYALANNNDDKLTGSSDSIFDEATVTIYDYFSDWELSGKKLTDHNELGSKNNGLDVVQGNLTPSTSFIFGSNNISYSYQGDLWNKAAATYYKGTSVSLPLFGSNSWFTGNGRYADVTGTGAYSIPDSRAYLTQFTKSTAEGGYGVSVVNEAQGLSNSRGFADLVEETEASEGGVALNGTGGKESPYFNKDFILGNNDAHAVYGAVYENVSFRFKKGTNDYYEYDSSNSSLRLTKNTANTTEDEYFLVYENTNKVTKADNTTAQFYPFNSSAANSSFAKENLMFGMKMSIPLITYADNATRTGMFKFSGDDDVWVYINREGGDNTLSLDIGGTHEACGGVIDMKNMKAVNATTYDSDDSTFGINGNSRTERTTTNEKALFALSTDTEIKEREQTLITETMNISFFSDTYKFEPGSGSGNSYYTTSIVPAAGKDYEYYKVTVNNVKINDEQVDSCTVYYRLFDIDKILNEDNADTVKYSVDVYVLERGLNSSNLRLAFKEADTTEREVEKVWTDKIQNFNSHTGDDVEVSLYRKVPVKATDIIDANGDPVIELDGYEYVDGTSEEYVWMYQKLDDKTLENTNKWDHIWDEYYDQVTLNLDGGGSVTCDIEYFITAEDVHDKLENYDTTYTVSVKLKEGVTGTPPADKTITPLNEATYKTVVIESEKDQDGHILSTYMAGEADLELVQFDHGTTPITDIHNIKIMITNNPIASLCLEKEWTIEESEVAEDITTPNPETITIDIYRETISYNQNTHTYETTEGPTKLPSLTVQFEPQFETRTSSDGSSYQVYDGTYCVKVGDAYIMDGTEKKVFEDTTYSLDGEKQQETVDGQVYSTLTWEFNAKVLGSILQDLHLYSANGDQYIYYAVEQDLTNQELEATYSPASGNKTALDGKKVYRFNTGASPYGLGTNNNNTFTMAIDNSKKAKPFNLQILKRDGDTGQPLPGVTFTLYVKDSDDTDDNYIELAVGRTDDEGIIDFAISELLSGAASDLTTKKKTYRLIETAALEGYEGEGEEISFSFNIKADGTIDEGSLVQPNGEIYGGFQLIPMKDDTNPADDGDEVVKYRLELTLNNYRIDTKVELPKSGGSGTDRFTWMGSLLIMMSLSLFACMRYKQKRKEVKYD